MVNRNIQAKQAKMRKAYLKHRRQGYDPNSDYALRTRGASSIDLASEVPPTITHGKRGLTMARAHGPTAVIKDAFTDDVENQGKRGAQKSTMIPRAAVKERHDALVAFSQTPFFQKYQHFLKLRISSRMIRWFSGDVHIYEKTFVQEGVVRVSVEYDTVSVNIIEKEGNERMLDRILWSHTFPLHSPDPSG